MDKGGGCGLGLSSCSGGLAGSLCKENAESVFDEEGELAGSWRGVGEIKGTMVVVCAGGLA